MPPADCDHNRGQLDYHMYCQWVRICATATFDESGKLAVIVKSWLRGSGPKNDPSRNDPNDPTLTLIGTTTWRSAVPPAGLGRLMGLAGKATVRQEVGITNLTVGP